MPQSFLILPQQCEVASEYCCADLIENFISWKNILLRTSCFIVMRIAEIRKNVNFNTSKC